jgi:hypothetical protein
MMYATSFGNMRASVVVKYDVTPDVASNDSHQKPISQYCFN